MGSISQVFLNSVSSVECLSNIFISLNKFLQFNIQILVLVLKNSAMASEGIYFGSNVSKSILQGVIAESDFIGFLSYT